MLERPGNGHRAILVGLDLGEVDHAGSVAELKQLTSSAGVAALATVGGRRARPDPAYFAGSGKVAELERIAEDLDADVVIFNHDLAPAQQRNLELKLKRRVVDRTSLILDIFAQRARSHEGKLQVELAQLQHLSTRLKHGWTHLERQKGGIGLRGPGETQLETDRRLLGNRVKVLRDKLDSAEEYVAKLHKFRITPVVAIYGQRIRTNEACVYDTKVRVGLLLKPSATHFAFENIRQSKRGSLVDFIV
jgi:GTP-binding protein HflX